MKVALMNGVIGLIACFGVGYYSLNMNYLDIALCLLVSLIAALVSLFFTLQIVKRFPSSKEANARLVRAWAFLVSSYLSLLFLLAPPMRSLQTFIYLIFPLILSSGFSILIFGPIQDYLVSAEQKKRR